MNCTTPEVTKDIKSYLDEIAERLWSGHAAVMVGSGFSKNATPHASTGHNFPDWNQLGDIFYKKIHGKYPDNKQKYMSVLKLADEVQAAFGRSVLDQIIRLHIPDENYEPSQLHIKLLELPWVDIFTTNYDTLLDRARIFVVSQKFDVVVNTKDLVYSEKPRIIKLHGSFPSERPFIVTEEDYRKYPSDYAPFVNTVQQSLLENTLCLIGFSGDDPNFLQWIGWIRDNLGKDNSPKIYLIGIFNLSNAQRKLLEQRNIIIIDMSACPNINGEHPKALGLFFDYLQSQKKANEKLDWPDRTHLDFYLRNEIIPQLKGVINSWKTVRESYPNWAILPEDCRKSLWRDTETWINALQHCNQLEVPQDIDFIYELNWRLEKCLCPIFNDNISTYKSIVEKYNPYPNLITIKTATVNKNKKEYKILDWKDIEIKWIQLNISILRFCREEGCFDEWNNINNRINQLYDILSPELVAQVHYERCLYALFSLKIADIREQIRLWPVNESLPFWEAKRAGLIAELGDIDSAEKILEKSLNDIRKQLNLSPVSDDYSWISREAFVMLLLQYIDSVGIFRKKNNNDTGNMWQRFSDRWRSLKQYKCDPWGELRIFKDYLEREPNYIPGITKKHEFDLGIVTSIHNFDKADTESLVAYTFLRYSEEAGLPFRLTNINISGDSAEGALKRIANYSPYWSFVTFVRTGDSKAADAIYNRKSINNIPAKQIDVLIAKYLEIIRSAQSEIEKGIPFQINNLGVVLAVTLPEILSRLCLKCSTKLKDEILMFLKDLYLSKQKRMYREIFNLTIRLFNSYSLAEQCIRLPELLEFPIPDDMNLITEIDCIDPFENITLTAKHINSFNDINIKQSVINDLLQKASSNIPCERKRAILRIAKLHELSLLNTEQIIKFSEAIWSQIDEKTGFPQNITFYKSAFLSHLPHPSNIDPVSLIKNYIKTEKFPIHKTKKEEGVTITNGNIPFFHEIVSATKGPFYDKGIDWSEQETLEMFYRLLDWWDNDKEFTKKDGKSLFHENIGDEFKQRFTKNITWVLNCVIIPRLSPHTSIKPELDRLLKELFEYNIPCIATHAVSLCVFPERNLEIVSKIKEALLSKKEILIKDGYDAIYHFYVLCNSGKLSEIPKELELLIATPIKWRNLPNLGYAIVTLTRILSDFPNAKIINFVDDVMFGLERLIDETDLESKQSIIGEVAERLDIRENAASLSYRLFSYYSKRNLAIPETLNKWKAICDDVEEFSDIRNSWETR